MSTKFLDTALNLTKEIETKSNELALTGEQYDAKRIEIARFEASLMQTIAAETIEESGAKDLVKTKPKYSNDAARNAELTARKAESDWLATATIALNDLSLKMTRGRNEIARIQAQVSLYKAFLHGGNELADFFAEANDGKAQAAVAVNEAAA